MLKSLESVVCKGFIQICNKSKMSKIFIDLFSTSIIHSCWWWMVVTRVMLFQI